MGPARRPPASSPTPGLLTDPKPIPKTNSQTLNLDVPAITNLNLIPSVPVLPRPPYRFHPGVYSVDTTEEYILKNNKGDGGNDGVIVQTNLFSLGVSVGVNVSLDMSGNVFTNISRFGVFINQGQAVKDQLDIKIEDNVLVGAPGSISGIRVFEQPGGVTLASSMDAGGGALGSEGNNSIACFAFDLSADGPYDLVAENNWYGSPAGPIAILELNGGTVDFEPFLTEDPALIEDEDDD